MKIGGDCFGPRYFSERSSLRKIPRSKTITDEFTQWPKQRWCKVINVINNRYFDNFVCFMCIFLTKTRRKRHFFIISVLIPVNEFWSVQTWRWLRDVISARIGVRWVRLFERLRLRANGARDNANVTRRSHYQKSLLRDNDRAVFRAKLVTIYVDWMALLHRLLMRPIALMHASKGILNLPTSSLHLCSRFQQNR